MRNFFNALLSALALVLFIPTVLILISWNAIPGDILYPLKRGLESVALALTIRTPIASAFSIEFTDRRFSEANRLLARNGSTLGYTLLVNQARESSQIIVDKKDTQSAAELVKKIDEYQKSLEEKKFAVQSQPGAFLPPTVSRVKTPTPSVAYAPATQQAAPAPPPSSPGQETVTPASSVSEVVDDIDKTQKQLEDIKKDIKKSLPPQAQENLEQQPGKSEEHRQNEENKIKSEDKGNSDHGKP